MGEEVGLKSYLEAFTAASNRARAASILIVVASVLVFSAVWNWSDLGWMDARLRIVRVAFEGCSHKWDPKYGASLPGEQSRLYWRARHYLELRYLDPDECEPIKAMVGDLSKARLEENLLIHVPFFGVVIDVNDLGIIGGSTFCILMLWLRVSLRRELGNLQLVFRSAPCDQQGVVYDLVSMREVLYFPPIRGQTARPKERHFVNVLYLLPALLQAATVATAAGMFRYAWTINRVDVVVDWGGGLVAFGLIVWLTVGCVRLSAEITREWVSQARALGILARKPTADVVGVGG